MDELKTLRENLAWFITKVRHGKGAPEKTLRLRALSVWNALGALGGSAELLGRDALIALENLGFSELTIQSDPDNPRKWSIRGTLDGKEYVLMDMHGISCGLSKFIEVVERGEKHGESPILGYKVDDLVGS